MPTMRPNVTKSYGAPGGDGRLHGEASLRPRGETARMGMPWGSLWKQQ